MDGISWAIMTPSNVHNQSLELVAKKKLKRAYYFLVCLLFRLLFLHILTQTHTLSFTPS